MATGLLATPAAAATGSAASAAKPKPAVSVGTPKASPSKYKGDCPVNVTFSSKIKVKAVAGKTTVAYRWLYGDGSKGKVKTFTFRGKGVKSFTVKDKGTFKGDVKGWQAVQVLAPRGATSGKGRFAVSCDGGGHDGGNDGGHEVVQPGIGATVWVDEGNCEAALIGRITASSSRWVRYQWVVNGHVVDSDAVRVNGSRKVVHVFKPRDDFRGWAALQIVDPVENSSNRAYFKIWCKDTTPKVSASVDAPSAYEGTCPVTRTFTGTIGVSHGDTRVKYRWIRDGVPGSWESVYFTGHGPQRQIVSDSWTASASGNASRAIELYDGSTTGAVKAEVTCKTPAPAPAPAPADTETAA
ncbi:hypothetical protein F4562_004131 [Streptosporangium becharense]|uniref:Uncharacterized protein n=2 Tax=Streptosporangium becharense TaxID=1816182 RepID=A0A7W9MI32_9ACTN|nr:hypothetical protein [Streptosporangium becharense]MBB5821069.1 hypothetical protein [Streptosporangium becharense]